MRTADYVMFSIASRCNNDCVICMLGPQKKTLQPLSFGRYKDLASLWAGSYPGIILSGAEVTLSRKLPEYIAVAKEKGFKKIMIQTNGVALADHGLVKELRSAGLNEVFVSFHAMGEALSLRISGRKGVFRDVVQALGNMEASGLEVMTNTVVTRLNYRILPQIAEFLSGYKSVKEVHFWAYVPLSARMDALGLPYISAAKYLNEAVGLLRRSGRKVCIKHFPVCLLAKKYRNFLDNSQPKVFGVKDLFFERWASCRFERCPSCPEERCSGLPALYRMSAEFREAGCFKIK